MESAGWARKYLQTVMMNSGTLCSDNQTSIMRETRTAHITVLTSGCALNEPIPAFARTDFKFGTFLLLHV